MLCYAMLCCAMLCYAMLCYVMLCYAMLYYAMLCYAMLCYAMLCYAVLCCAVICYAMLCCAMLCYAILCYAMLCYAMLYYTMLYYAMLCCDSDFCNAINSYYFYLFLQIVKPENVEVLVDTGAFTGFKKVQIQIRLEAKSFHFRSQALTMGQLIIDRVNERTFLGDLVWALNSTSYKQDFIDYSKFGWILPGFDIVLLSATGFPVTGYDRNPDYKQDSPSKAKKEAEAAATAASDREERLMLILAGVGLGAAVLVGLLALLYCRLRRQYVDLEKDKGDVPANLRAMWKRCVTLYLKCFFLFFLFSSLVFLFFTVNYYNIHIIMFLYY
jgi:hypothetical protein